ncbi:MAG: ATP-binding cassette domain-containing protein [Sphingobacteriales bacterium]|uniref:ATP-binding cassette domain-containing protein n=1 Tax=Hydrotalea flava TaxID=714549 RepID=UPI000F9CD885|nr:ATP-binding cassette domain-containing protein [Hydrotalea flava]RTL48125.1 MAG: ATP-binding cassette domain-containing protein [Sphingobacteriales bacterium]
MMHLHIENLVPVPLKPNLQTRNSDIWLQDVEFTSGHFIKIKAPSGSGKTTFIHLLYHLRNDYEGSIYWNNQEQKQYHAAQLAILRQQNISIIFQDLRLFQNITARENIELKRVMQQPYYPSSVIDDMAEQLGIAKILNQRTGICSYGEQQRIAIIRALMQPFNWLLMDEPFSHLDHDNTAKATALIAEECNKRKAGFILTDLDEDTHFTYHQTLQL